MAPAAGTGVSPGAAPAAGAVGGVDGNRPVRAAAWPSLPPLQRATAGRGSVADSGFGGRLTTWQNPSFTGTLSHAVLDGAPGGLVRGVLATPALPASGLELPSLALPVAAPEEPSDHVGGSSLRHAGLPVAATGPAGPRVTAVPPAATRPPAPTGLTRAPAGPAVQRRALPVVTPSVSGRAATGPSVPTVASAPPLSGPPVTPAGPGPADAAPSGSSTDAGPGVPSVSVPRSSHGGATTGPGLPVRRRTSGGTGRTVPGAPGTADPAPVSAPPKPPAGVPTAGTPRRRSALGAPLSSPPSDVAPAVRLDSPVAAPERGHPAPVRATGTPAVRPAATGGGTSSGTPSAGAGALSGPAGAGLPVQRAVSSAAPDPASSGVPGTEDDRHRPAVRNGSEQSSAPAVPPRPPVRALAPARALTSALPAAPPATAVQRRTTAAVPLRRTAPTNEPPGGGGSGGG
ncbi:hypothetical protein ACWD74_39605, partial [Streptomyces fagopyri]